RPLRFTLFPYTTLFRSLISETRWGEGFSEACAAAEAGPHGAMLEEARRTALRSVAADGLPVHPCHGDFMSWNMRSVEGRLLLYEDRKSTRLNSSHDQIS